MTRRLLPLALLATLILSACVSPTGQTQVASVEGPVAAVITNVPVDPNVKPGPTAVSLVDATMMFDRVCVSHYPDLKASEAEIRKMPFRQASTGTWFHQQLDLSFKLIPERRACSLVFGSREDPMQLALALAAQATRNQQVGFALTGQTMTKGPAGSTFEFSPTSRGSNRSYFHAVLYR
jgi:hypothetical protein